MTLPAALEQSPRLALYLREIQAKLAAEAEARRRFFEETPENVKAEFINGEIIVNPPVGIEHASASDLLLIVLKTWVMREKLGFVGHEKLLVCLTRNDYEPDIAFWGRAKADTFEAGQRRFPAPDFIAEVLSPSTKKTDRTIKMDDYAAHGVDEYWLVDPDQRIVEQYLLEGDQYQLALKSGSGQISSRAVPGFTVPIAAIFDEGANLQALRRILV